MRLLFTVVRQKKLVPNKKLVCPRVCFFVFWKCFVLFVYGPPEFLLLLLEQGESALEDHTRDFLDLAYLTHYPDDCLCTFYKVSLNLNGPRRNFAAYVEWVLVSCNSAFINRPRWQGFHQPPTPDPEPSQASPCCVEHQPEPTADRAPEPTATDEPSPREATELRIAPEPEPHTTSDQVREPAPTHAMVDETVERMRAEVSPRPLHHRWGWAEPGLWGLNWRLLGNTLSPFIWIFFLSWYGQSQPQPQWSSKEFCRLCGVGAGELQLSIHKSASLTRISPAPHSGPRAQPSITLLREHQPEPTADRAPEPTATDEPSPREATELRIALEPELTQHLTRCESRHLRTQWWMRQWSAWEQR